MNNNKKAIYHSGQNKMAVFLILLIIAIFILPTLGSYYEPALPGFLILYFFVASWILIAGYSPFSYTARRAKKVIANRKYIFSKHSGYGQNSQKAIIKELGYYAKKHVIQETDSELLYDIIFGSIRRKKTALGWNSGSRNTRGTEYYTVFEQKLSRKLPHILFDSKHAKGEQFKRQYSKKQVISFDVNFDDYFRVYLPNNYHIDTLSFVTPDVLQALLDIKDTDVEIIEDRLYVYAPLVKNEGLKDFKKRATQVKQTLEKNINTYRDDRLPKKQGREDVLWASKKLTINTWQYTKDAILLIAIGLFLSFATFIAWDSKNILALTVLCIMGIGFLLVSIQLFSDFLSIRRNHKQKLELLQGIRQITAE